MKYLLFFKFFNKIQFFEQRVKKIFNETYKKDR